MNKQTTVKHRCTPTLSPRAPNENWRRYDSAPIHVAGVDMVAGSAIQKGISRPSPALSAGESGAFSAPGGSRSLSELRSRKRLAPGFALRGALVRLTDALPVFWTPLRKATERLSLGADAMLELSEPGSDEEGAPGS